MNSKTDIIKYLNQDEVRNINMVNFIKNYPVYDIETEGDSVLIIGKSDERWVYISSQSEQELRVLLNRIKNEEYFAIVEDWMLPEIIRGKTVDWILSCMKLNYPEHIVLPESRFNAIKLSPQEAGYIYENCDYKQYTSIGYITERIEKGIALGIYEHNLLVGWIITHDDGAMGFLNVLPEYRRKGYAYDLTISMIRELRKVREIPFVHIEESNSKSMGLALKAGFLKDRLIHWVKLRNS